MKSQRDTITAYRTLDGSLIRELMHPDHHRVEHQSLAEATIPARTATHLHLHRESEELYHVTAGSGQMQLGDQLFAIEVGDTVAIPPGTPHRVENRGDGPLVLLCCCSPPYRHDDTELLEP